MKAQLHKKARMNGKRYTIGYASEELMHQREKKELLSEEQVVGQLDVGVLLLINEMKFSIYRFLVSDTKNAKKWPQLVKFRFDRLTSCFIKCIVGDCRISIEKIYPSIGKTYPSIGNA